VLTLLLLAPVFMLFELWQLVLSERYLGIKQIERGADPRALGLGEFTAFCWSAALFLYWAWMLGLLLFPFGRGHAALLLLISAIGYFLRRGCSLKWVLVILTFEGALRIGLLLSLFVFAWRRL
jgi:hypothetical protein